MMQNDMQMKVKFQTNWKIKKKIQPKSELSPRQLLEMRVWLSQRNDSMLEFLVEVVCRAHFLVNDGSQNCEWKNGARCQTNNIILINILVLCCMPNHETISHSEATQHTRKIYINSLVCLWAFFISLFSSLEMIASRECGSLEMCSFIIGVILVRWVNHWVMSLSSLLFINRINDFWF